MTSEAKTTNIFLRNDTIFGTCQAIGEDYGFNPNWLRIPLAASVVFNPFVAVGAYLALSLLVFATRSLFRAKAPQVLAEHRVDVTAPVLANDQIEDRIAA